MRKQIIGGLREILAQMKAWKPKEYFVYPQGVCRIRKPPLSATAALYFEAFKLHSCGKRSASPAARCFGNCAPLKRERGECFIHPAVAPVSLYRAVSLVLTHSANASGGQNLAALCTTAGQNLTAVGSSHSLTETVNLGTMTTAGLVGTLHNTYTSYMFSFSYARQPKGRSNTL